MQKVIQLLRSTLFVACRKWLSCFHNMLLTTLLLLFTLHVNSQQLTQKKVTLNLKGTSVKDALMSIQRQSSVTFVYSQDIARYARVKVTLAEKEVTIKRAIELILKNTNLRYRQLDDQIVIDENPMSKKAGQGNAASTVRIIKGYVTDSLSQPLPGVNVCSKIIKQELLQMLKAHFQSQFLTTIVYLFSPLWG